MALAWVAQPALAFDPSKVVNEKTTSQKVIEFFFSFTRDGKQEEALSVLEYAAERGDSVAEWKLARIYQTGEGVEADPLKAFRVFQNIAAKYPDARPNTPSWQFSAGALVALGDYYRTGIPGTEVAQDRNKALMMYTTAAMVFHHPQALFELGRMQIENDNRFGQGALGIRNLSRAMRRGHVGAEALLGYMIFEGSHTRRDAVRDLVMLGDARNRANEVDLEWIEPLFVEAMAIALPHERAAAVARLETVSASTEVPQ